MSREEYFNKLVRINGEKLDKLKEKAKKENLSVARYLDLLLEKFIN